jgi:hypothetical protein
MRQEHLPGEAEAMAISFPAPEAAPSGRLESDGERAESRIVSGGHVLRRFYERVCSAIFDPDGDCMRF